MSLRIQNTPRTLKVSGTEIVYFEIYKGEQYIYPIQFKSGATPIDVTGWTFAATTTYYTGTYTAAEPSSAATNVTISNLTAVANATPTQQVTVSVVNAATGNLTLTIPPGISPTNYAFPVTDNPVLIAVVSLNVTRTDTTISREPIGFIIRTF